MKGGAETTNKLDGAFHAIFEASGVGIVVADLAGHILEANPALAAMLGYAPAELVGTHYTEISHPDDLPLEGDLIADLRSGKCTHFRLKKRFLARSGQVICARLTLSTFRDSAHDQPQLVGIVENLTDYCLLREPTDQSGHEAIHSDTRQHVAWKWTLLTDSLWVAKAAYSLLGYGPQQMPGTMRKYLDMVHPGDKYRLIESIASAISAGRDCWRCEYRVRHANGQYLWLFCDGQLVNDSSGHLLRAVGTVVDITENKRVQEEAEHSSKMAALQKSILANLGQYGLAGVGLDELLLHVVQGARQGLGAELCALMVQEGKELRLQAGAGWLPIIIGTELGDLPQDSPEALALRSPTPIVVENFSLDRISQISPASLHEEMTALFAGVQTESRPFGVLIAIRRSRRRFTDSDVSFLQAVAATLSLSIVRQRAEQTRRSLLHRFISLQQKERKMVAQELHDEAGQSLTAVLVGLRTIMNSRRLSEAKQLAANLRDIVANTMEDIGRLARGLHPAVLDDLGLAVALERYLAEFSSNYDISVEQRIEGLGSSQLPNDMQLTVFRIVQEALTNVVKHSGANRVQVDIAFESSTVRISIADNGHGFNPQDYENDPEHMGLSGMKERAALLGGALRICSDPEHGTRVNVRFPYTCQKR